jgi:hypothetical protein
MVLAKVVYPQGDRSAVRIEKNAVAAALFRGLD